MTFSCTKIINNKKMYEVLISVKDSKPWPIDKYNVGRYKSTGILVIWTSIQLWITNSEQNTHLHHFRRFMSLIA